MNLYRAGMDILYRLMTADNEIDDTELREILSYLFRGKVARETAACRGESVMDVLIEMGILSAMDSTGLDGRFREAGAYFGQNASDAQKERIMELARRMVNADGRVTSGEAAALRDLERMLTGESGK